MYNTWNNSPMMLGPIVGQRLLQQPTPVFAPAEVVDMLLGQDRVYEVSIARPGTIPLCAASRAYVITFTHLH